MAHIVYVNSTNSAAVVLAFQKLAVELDRDAVP
jgi:hypothetical protein